MIRERQDTHIGFMCLQQAKSGGENYVVSPMALYNEIGRRRPDLLGVLEQPGDILFLNNWVTFHRRSEFEDHEEPARKRHLLRIWLSVPNSRPLNPMYRDNYGATEAGAIRGGMREANPRDST